MRSNNPKWAMQYTASAPAQAGSSSQRATATPALQHVSTTLPLRARRTRRPVVVTSSLGGMSGADGVRLASQLVSTVAIAVGAWILTNQMSAQENHPENGRPCPSCGGSGYEPCICQRWSDKDVGCRSCSKTGYMQCRACGGGGTAVPIAVAIRKHDVRPMQ